MLSGPSEDDKPHLSREAIVSGVGESQRFQGEGMENQCDYNYYDNNGFLRCHPLTSSAPCLPSPILLETAAAKFSKTPFSFF